MRISIKTTLLLLAFLLSVSLQPVYAADSEAGNNAGIIAENNAANNTANNTGTGTSVITDVSQTEDSSENLLFTGLKMTDGLWRYYENGKINLKYTGIAANMKGSWYLKNGVIVTSYTGMVKFKSTWWYVVRGKVNTTYTGFVKDKTATWYFKDGKRQDTFTGGVETGKKAYQIKKGKVIFPDIASRITKTYRAIRSLSGRRSFNGYCGKFSNWTLKYLGINKTYISGNGKDEFEHYKNRKKTSGGYTVHAYSSKKYSLESALKAITVDGTKSVYNILVGFDKGSTSRAGQTYGHTFFIHAIINGNVYYSESFTNVYAGKTYAEGKVIKCTIAELALHYKTGKFRKSKFDGVIYFTK